MAESHMPRFIFQPFVTFLFDFVDMLFPLRGKLDGIMLEMTQAVPYHYRFLLSGEHEG